MNANKSSKNNKAKGVRTIKKNNIMYKMQKRLNPEEIKWAVTPNGFKRNLNPNVKQGAMKALSPFPQRFNGNFQNQNRKN